MLGVGKQQDSGPVESGLDTVALDLLIEMLVAQSTFYRKVPGNCFSFITTTSFYFKIRRWPLKILVEFEVFNLGARLNTVNSPETGHYPFP